MGCIFGGHRLHFNALILPVFQGRQDIRQKVSGDSTEFYVSWICYIGEPQLRGNSCANKNIIEVF